MKRNVLLSDSDDDWNQSLDSIRLNPFFESIKEAKTDQKRRKQDQKKTTAKPRNVDE